MIKWTYISSARGSVLWLGSNVVLSVITQFLDQIKVKDTSQLINNISDVFQKLRKCFNGIENWTFLVFPLLAVLPVILVFYLKDLEFVKESAEISFI